MNKVGLILALILAFRFFKAAHMPIQLNGSETVKYMCDEDFARAIDFTSLIVKLISDALFALSIWLLLTKW